jgi:hypothetical protein
LSERKRTRNGKKGKQMTQRSVKGEEEGSGRRRESVEKGRAV